MVFAVWYWKMIEKKHTVETRMIRVFKKWVFLLIAAILLYLVGGLMAPFIFLKKTDAGQMERTRQLVSAYFPGEEKTIAANAPAEGKEKNNAYAVKEPAYGEKSTGGNSGDSTNRLTGAERAMILETNTSAWEERIRLFSMAQERIVLTTFDMRDCESTRDLLSVLLDRAENGVQVQILVDGISGVYRMDGNPLFYAVSSHPNVEVRLYNKLNPFLPWKTQGRMHDKYIIADEFAYVLGGRNTFDYFIGDYPTENRSHDREVLVYQADPEKKGESLMQLEQYFDGMWNNKETTVFHDDPALADEEEVKTEITSLKERYVSIRESRPELFEDYDYGKVTHETEKISLLSNPTGIYGKEPVVFHQLVEMMLQAEDRVVIQTPYIVCNAYMLGELEKVKNTVPDSRLLINSVENGDNFMASSDYLYRKKGIWETGIPVYEYDGGDSSHGKSIVIDDSISIIGSYNMDLRSTYVDTELMLVIKSPELTAELEGYMKSMEINSRRVTEDGTYEFPEHVKPEEIPFKKKIAMHIVGLFMQPFRVMV